MNLPYESLMWLRLLHERQGTDLQPYEVSHRDAVLDYISSLETELAEEKRLAGCGSEREAALQGKYDRLQARLTEIGKAEVDRWKEGAASERRKVVSFLREPMPEAFSPEEYADWIERGDHAENKDERAEADFKALRQRMATEGYARTYGVERVSKPNNDERAEEESKTMWQRLSTVRYMRIHETAQEAEGRAERAKREQVEQTKQAMNRFKALGQRYGIEIRAIPDDHDYREVTYDRNDRPISPTCAHCGHAKENCRGRKP